MGQRLLRVWYFVLILLLLELIGYGLTGYMMNSCRNLAWDGFNERAHTLKDVDTKVPYSEYINPYARDVGISPQVVAGIIQAESSFQPRALSAAGAYGLMQIMPATWRQVNNEVKVCTGRHKGECSSECYYNADLNIHIGTAYLGQLVKRYQGNMVLALAAYNAGPGIVDHYGGMPPYLETINYTERVIGTWYNLEYKQSPYPTVSMSKQWDKVHKMMGWVLTFTVMVAVWIIWRLFRYQSSWRWR